jgi:hypothetical protein
MMTVLDNVSETTTAVTATPEAIEKRKREAADRAGIELSEDLESPGVVTTAPVRNEPTEEQLAASQDRLKALRLAS